ncbi:MAG: ABC transporter permease [Clostridiales bacterium]|nr:ABC transporter permease [Clostridiales bacterium]
MRVKATLHRIAVSAGRKIKMFFAKLFRVLPFVFVALALLGIVLSSIQIVRLKDLQYDQFAAQRWVGDSDKAYRQVSVIGRGQVQGDGSAALFLDSKSSMNINTIIEIRQTLDDLVSTAKGDKTGPVVDDNDTEGARVWVDAYYSNAQATFRTLIDENDRAITTEAEVVGVAGNYYLFHPRQILSGSFLSEERIDPQSVVLNEQLAWILFKSTEICDMKVEIGSKEYTIVGVVREPDGKSDRAAGLSMPRAYVYFNELADMNQSQNEIGEMPEYFEDVPMMPAENGATASEDLAILCYEAVLPDPIKNIAFNDLKSSLSTYVPGEENFYFVNHTDRFGLIRLFENRLPIGAEASIHSKFSLPPSELSAQITEQQLVVWWSVLFASSFFMVISLVASFLILKKRRGETIDFDGQDSENAIEETKPEDTGNAFSSIRRV